MYFTNVESRKKIFDFYLYDARRSGADWIIIDSDNYCAFARLSDSATDAEIIAAAAERLGFDLDADSIQVVRSELEDENDPDAVRLYYELRDLCGCPLFGLVAESI